MAFTFSVLPNHYEAIGEEGPYTAVNYFVECRDLAGNTWVHFKAFDSAWDADLLADKIADRRPEGWTPDNDYWVRGRTVYGSQAFQANNGEHGLQKADVEAEFGPGSYAEGQPGHLAH